MAEFDINLNEVQFKPPLRPSDYTFAVISASLEQAREPNKRSGVREWMVRCELKPLEADGYTVLHNWSLSQAALEVEDPSISIKKLYEVMGAAIGSKINTDDFLGFRFTGTTKLEEYNGKQQARLARVLGPVV